MSILISGRGKSGTTGMYNTVKASLPPSEPDWVCVFEPSVPEPMQALRRLAPDAPVLTKVIFNRESQAGIDLADFDQRVMMVRDPRDVVISTLLFRPLVVRSMRRVSDENNEKYISAIEEKEADPESWSVQDLHKLGDELGLAGGKWSASQVEMIELAQRIRESNYFPMAYEDFVDKKFDSLSEYLGFTVGTVDEDDRSTNSEWLSHISRSKDFGAWKHWFLPSDVEFFGNLYREFSSQHGYDDDWELAESPSIDPATSSQHIRTRLAGRREQLAAASGDLEASDFTAESLAVLEGQASDGVLRAARIASEVRRDGPEDLRDLERSFTWAQLAAWMGDARGTELLVESYRLGIGTSPDSAAADLWADRLPTARPKAKQRSGNQKAKKRSDASPAKTAPGPRVRRIAELEAEVDALNRQLAEAKTAHAAEIDQVMSSKRFRIGDAVVRGLTVPKKLFGRDA